MTAIPTADHLWSRLVALVGLRLPEAREDGFDDFLERHRQTLLRQLAAQIPVTRPHREQNIP